MKSRLILLTLLLSHASYVYCSSDKMLLIKSLKSFEAYRVETCVSEKEVFLAPLGVTVPENKKWSKKSIIVCWAKKADQEKICRSPDSFPNIQDEPSNAKELKKEIQEIISQEYTIEKTGIQYQGWKDCSENEPHDVMIFASSFSSPLIQGAAGEASIGPCSNYSSNQNGTPYVILGSNEAPNLKISRIDDIRMTALHEFGHLSGLHHEHLNHPDIIKASNNLPSENEHLVSTSAKDEQSIMNYEFNLLLQTKGLTFTQDKIKRSLSLETKNVKISSIDEKQEEVNVKIGLSPGDSNALKCLYVYNTAEKIINCHSKAKP